MFPHLHQNQEAKSILANHQGKLKNSVPKAKPSVYFAMIWYHGSDILVTTNNELLPCVELAHVDVNSFSINENHPEFVSLMAMGHDWCQSSLFEKELQRDKFCHFKKSVVEAAQKMMRIFKVNDLGMLHDVIVTVKTGSVFILSVRHVHSIKNLHVPDGYGWTNRLRFEQRVYLAHEELSIKEYIEEMPVPKRWIETAIGTVKTKQQKIDPGTYVGYLRYYHGTQFCSLQY